MNKRRFFFLLALALALSGRPSHAVDKSVRPNVIFILSDDQRCDTIAALGNPEISTPNLDALVRRGFVFRNAYCMGAMTGAVCAPSRTMLMTGRSLWRIPAPATRAWEHPSLGSIFRDAGYDTLFVGKRSNTFIAGNETFEKVVYDEERADKTQGRAGSSQFHAETTINWLKSGKRSSVPYLLRCDFVPRSSHRAGASCYAQRIRSSRQHLDHLHE